MDLQIIKEHPLFCGLSPQELKQALTFFHAREKVYKKGEFLNTVSMPLTQFGMVTAGIIQVYMDDLNGDHMIMANVTAGETFGESLCYLEMEAPVYICAETESSVLWLSVSEMKKHHTKNHFTGKMTNRFTAMLASRTLAMNDRIQILSKMTIRGKVIAFLTQYLHHFGTSFLVPFDRASMAIYLGCERSALSRELSKLEKEGVITFHKNSFQIIGTLDEQGKE